MSNPTVQPVAAASPRIDENREIELPASSTSSGSSPADPFAVTRGATVLSGSPGVGLMLGALSLFDRGSPRRLSQSDARALADRFGGPLDPLRLRVGVGGSSLRGADTTTNSGEITVSAAYLPIAPHLGATVDYGDVLLSSPRYVLMPYLEIDGSLRANTDGVGHRVDARVLTVGGWAGEAHDQRSATDAAGRPTIIVGPAHSGVDLRFVTLGATSERGIDGLGTEAHGATLSVIDASGRVRVADGSVPLTLSGSLGMGKFTFGTATIGADVLNRAPSVAVMVRPIGFGLGVEAELGTVRLALEGTVAMESIGDMDINEPHATRTTYGGRLSAARNFNGGDEWRLFVGIDRTDATLDVVTDRTKAQELLDEGSSWRVGAGIEFAPRF